MWGCNEYGQYRHSRERQCRVPPSYCPNKQIESCRNECPYSPNNYNICTEQTLRWLCRYRLENRRSCSAPPRRLLTYEGGTLSIEGRGKSPRRLKSSSKMDKSRKMSPRKKAGTKTERPKRDRSSKKSKKEACPKTQCVLSDKDRKNMEEKLRLLRTCGQPGCQAYRQKKQIEEALFGTTSVKCDSPKSPCCTEKVKSQVSLKAKTYKEETQVSLKAKPYKEETQVSLKAKPYKEETQASLKAKPYKAEKKSSLVQEHEYLYFMLGITENILKNNKYTVDEMEKVFKSHMAAHKGRLDEAKMQEHIDHLKKHLNYPTCVCDEQVGSDDHCICCPALTIDHATNERRKCSCEDPRCPTHTNTESVIVKREENGVGGTNVDSREGSDVMRKPSVEGGGVKRDNEKSSQVSLPKNTESGTGRIWKEESGTGGGGEEKTKTDDIKKKSYGTTGQSSAQEVKTIKSSLSVEKRGSEGSKEKNSQTDNTQKCIDPAACSTIPGKAPATSLSKANFTISGIDKLRIRETNNDGKANSKTEDKLSEVVFYNPEVGSTCHCTIAIRKTALKIQSDSDDVDNEEYVLVEGPVCMPKKMLEQKTVPVMIENISSMMLGSDSDFGDHKKRDGPSESRVNLFQSSTTRNSMVVANGADSISGYITIADLKTKDGDATTPQPEKESYEEQTEYDRSKGRPSIVQIKPNVSYISISVSIASKSTASDQAKIDEAKKVSSDQPKNNYDKEIVNTDRKEEVSPKENSSVYHERGGDDILNHQQADEVKTMSEPKMKTNYSNMSYTYESWTRLITSDADIKYFTIGHDKKGLVIKPPPRQMKAHEEESEECFYIPRRIKSENISSKKEVIPNDLEKLLQQNDTKILDVERQLTDADQDIAILRKEESETEISNNTIQSEDNKLNDTEALSITNKDDLDGKRKNINSVRSLDLENMNVEYKMKSGSVVSVNNETRVSQNNIAKQKESVAEISKTDSSKATVCVEAEETGTLLNQVKISDSGKSSGSSVKDETSLETSLEVEMQGSKSKNKLANNQADYKAALARFEHLKPKLRNITITKSDPTHDRHASKTFRLCTGEKTQSGSIHVMHIGFPKSKEVIRKLDTVSTEEFNTTTDEPPSQKDLSDFRSKYHYLLKDAVTNVSSTDLCNTDESFKEKPKEQIQVNKDPQPDVPCETLITLEPSTIASPITIAMPVLVPSVPILEDDQLQGGSSPFYFPQLATGYLTRPTKPLVSQTHDKKQSILMNSHTDDSQRPPESNKDTHSTKYSVANSEISKEVNLPRIFEFSNRGQKRSMDFASSSGGENYTYQRKRKSPSGMESSTSKSPVLDKENFNCSPIPFPIHAASVSSTDDHSSLSETSVLLLKNKERLTVTRSLNLEGDDHEDIIAQLDEIPEPDRTPNQISAIRDVTMKMEDFRTIDPSCVGRKFRYTNPESFNIRRESFEY